MRVSLLPKDGPLVAEGPEAGAAVVVPHAAGADAAEREVRVREVEQRVVDADPAGGGLGERVLDGAVAFREDVERERLRPAPDVGRASSSARYVTHRKDRAEDLLLEHRRVRGDVDQDRGREVALGSFA